MSDGCNFNDTEYTWPPGALTHERPQPGPELAGMRLDCIEMRLAGLERGHGDTGRQLTDIEEAITVAIDALTYLAGSVERLRVTLAPDERTRRQP